MYNSGDNLNAIVADIGSFSTRIGYAGEDTPKAYLQTMVGVRNSQDHISCIKESSYVYDFIKNQDNIHIESPYRDGLISNWDLFENLLEYSIKTYFPSNFSLSESPLLLSEKPYQPIALRYKLCETMFEKYQTPALFISKDPVLSLYATGKTSGLVVDIGGSGTVVSPVVDGWVEQKGVSRSIIGGRLIDSQIEKIIKSQDHFIPLYRLSKTWNENFGLQVSMKANLNNIQSSYDSYQRLELARDIKETLSKLSDSTLLEDDVRYTSIPFIPYELPDGTIVDVNIERFQIGELLIDPSSIDPLNNVHYNTLYPPLITPNTTSSNNSTSNGYHVPGSIDGVPKVLGDAVVRCDADIQAMLLYNIVLAGGSSCIEGLQDRLKLELEKKLIASGTVGSRVRMFAVGLNERPLCPWLGGSIVASLGSFHELWVSKKEYEEYGTSIIDRKCP